MFPQGARGNDGAAGAAGPPVSSQLFNPHYVFVLSVSTFNFNFILKITQ